MRAPYILATSLVLLAGASPARAQADLSDLEMAHAAVTASDIDIAYAHLALALSEDPTVRAFAETMIRDHSAVNAQVAALAERLDVQPADNAFSRQLAADASRIKDEMTRLRGLEFDRYYAANELQYHQAVNGVVSEAFIPHVEHPEVKRAFEAALPIFRGHERHAQQLVTDLAEAVK